MDSILSLFYQDSYLGLLKSSLLYVLFRFEGNYRATTDCSQRKSNFDFCL